VARNGCGDSGPTPFTSPFLIASKTRDEPQGRERAYFENKREIILDSSEQLVYLQLRGEEGRGGEDDAKVEPRLPRNDEV